MSSAVLPTLPELNRQAYSILCRELGVPATLRIFSQMGIGQGNYTEERKGLFANLTMNAFEQGIEQLRQTDKD